MMDYFASLGIILCFAVAPIVAQEFVTVGRDVVVKPTPNPLTDVSQRVDARLNCTGSQSALSYYHVNPVSWYHIHNNESKLPLTNKFYSSDQAKDLFKGTDARYKLIYGKKGNGFGFDIEITGVTHSDNGIFRCILRDENSAVIDTKDVALTVVSPVQELAIELHDMKHSVIARSDISLSKNATPWTIPAGQYMIKCDCYGSNPAPTMAIWYNNNILNSKVEAVQSQLNNRVSYNGSVSIMSQTITPHEAVQIIKCSANIPGDFYPKVEREIVLMVTNYQMETTPEVTPEVTLAVTTDVTNKAPNFSVPQAVALLPVSIISLTKTLF